MTGAAGVRVITFSHDQIAGVARRQRSGDAARQLLALLDDERRGVVRRARSRRACRRVLFARGGAFSLSMTRDPLVIARRLADPDC